MSQPGQPPTPNRSAPRGAATPGIARRTVIHGAGVAGVAVVTAATLAACGGSSDTATSAGKPAANPTGAAPPAGGAIKAADIPVGGGKVFEAEEVVVTQPKAGEFKAFSAICTHQGCIVQTVANGTINCPCHGSTFDMTTGAVINGPATAPLPPKTATATGDSITVS